MVFFFHKKNSIGPLLRLPFFNFNDPSTTFKMEAASNTHTHTHTHTHEWNERENGNRERGRKFFSSNTSVSHPPSLLNYENHFIPIHTCQHQTLPSDRFHGFLHDWRSLGTFNSQTKIGSQRYPVLGLDHLYRHWTEMGRIHQRHLSKQEYSKMA